MPFDPDKYLATKPEPAEEPKPVDTPSAGFDPDKYLSTVSQPPDTVAGAQPPEGAKAPKGEEDVDYGKAFMRGAREVVAPFSVTKEEVEEGKQNTWGETFAELAGSIGVDLAAAAAATKAGAVFGSFVAPGMGTAIGAGAGLLGYALYSGIGQEKVAEQRSGEFSTGRAAARVALSINPLARYGGVLHKAFAKAGSWADDILKAGEKTAVRVGRVAAQAGGEAAVAGSEFGEQAAGLAGALSLVMHSIGFRKSGINPQESGKIGAFVESPEGTKTAGRIAKRVHDEAGRLAREGTYSPDKVDHQFASYVLGKKVRQPIARAKRYMESVSNPDEIYTDYLVHQITKEELGKTLNELRAKVTKGGKFVDDSAGDVKAVLRDGQAVAREMDRQAGLGITEALNDLSEARGRFENFQVLADSAAWRAYRLQKKAKISDDEMGKLRIVLSGEEGSERFREGLDRFFDASGQLNPKAKKAVDAWTDVWDMLKNEIETNRFHVGTRQFYFPEMKATGSQLLGNVKETINAVNGLSKEMPRSLAEWSTEGLTKAGMSQKSASELMESIIELKKLRRRYGIKEDGFTVNSLYQLQNSILEKNPRSRSGAELSAIFERGATPIPPKYRELNNRQAYLNYMNGNVKGAMMSDSIRHMSGYAQALSANNMEHSATWINNMLDDISGGTRSNVRHWFANKENQIRYRIQEGMKNSASGWEQLGWKAANVANEGFGAMQAALYPAYVGMNVAANVRNLTQNLVQAAPEIGGAYGYNVVGRASLKNPFKHYKRLLKDGVIARGATAEAIRPDDSRFLQRWGKWGDNAMLVYQSTDTLNRLLSYNIGHTMAQDLAKGNKLAIEALERLGPAVVTTLRKNGLDSLEAFRRDPDKLGDVLGKLMIGKTQFHYGAEQKAQFLRDIGPLFSMFTKWPVSIASDIGTIMRENPKLKDKAYRFMERYGAVWAIAAYASSYQSEADPMANYVMGNLKTYAPLQSVVDFSLLNNPRVEAAMSIPAIAKKVFEAEDPNEALKNLAKAVTREGIKLGVPGVSSIINELDKVKSKKGETPVTQEWVDEMFGE